MPVDEGGPKISLWYGRRQVFGARGLPQRWFNLLGRVHSTGPLKLLEYSLNGEAFQKLSTGPDRRRLAGTGDFNVDIDIRRLQPGENRIELLALDEQGRQALEQAGLVYTPAACPLPYAVHWQELSQIQEAVTVVDGRWLLEGGQVSPYETGYDRLLAFGDITWKDYEVCAPLTLHAINAACYEYPSIHAGVGFVMRWQGHSDWGSDAYASGQPCFGPGPYGAIAWYCVFLEQGPLLNFFDPQFKRMAEKPLALALHRPYWFKARVETLASGASLYSMRVWEQGQAEPGAWDIQSPGHAEGLTEGACLFVAHHAAASLGDLAVRAS